MRKTRKFNKPKVAKTESGKFVIRFKDPDDKPVGTKVCDTEEEALKEYNNKLIDMFLEHEDFTKKLPKGIGFSKTRKSFMLQVYVNKQKVVLLNSKFLYEIVEFRKRLIESLLDL